MCNGKVIHLKKYLILICITIIIVGCAPNKYGYTLDKWNSFTQQQRKDIKIEEEEKEAEAEALTKKMMDDQRERKFVNKPINAIFGTRSNVY